MSAPSKNVIEVSGARVRQGAEDLLPPTTLSFPPGEVVIALGTPGPALTALALAVGGRLPLSDGSVTYDGLSDAAVLRRCVALVDVPTVTEPERGVPVRTIVAEELAFAGRPNGRHAAEQWLTDHGRADWGGLRAEQVPALERVNALTDLAALRPGITHVVIGFPERHGGPPSEWLAVAQRHADAGLGVLLTVSHATATDHDATYVVGAPTTPVESDEAHPDPVAETADEDAPPQDAPSPEADELPGPEPVGSHEVPVEANRAAETDAEPAADARVEEPTPEPDRTPQAAPEQTGTEDDAEEENR